MTNNGLIGKFYAKPGDMVAIIFISRSFNHGEKQSRIYGEIAYSNHEEVCIVPVGPGNKRDEDRRKLFNLRDCLSYSINT
jgi:hypothetical protein